MRSQGGELVYDAGNICNHFMTTEFLNEICRFFFKVKKTIRNYNS